MSDQMPDEVWLYHPSRVDRDDVIGSKWTAYETDVGGAETHYIRADLYERVGEFDHQGIDPADLGAHLTDAMQALTTRNAVSKAACAQLIAEQAQRAEQAEAKRDRLRAAVSEARRRIGIYIEDECSYDETLEMGHFVLDAFHGLQESLDHD